MIAPTFAERAQKVFQLSAWRGFNRGVIAPLEAEIKRAEKDGRHDAAKLATEMLTRAIANSTDITRANFFIMGAREALGNLPAGTFAGASTRKCFIGVAVDDDVSRVTALSFAAAEVETRPRRTVRERGWQTGDRNNRRWKTCLHESCHATGLLIAGGTAAQALHSIVVRDEPLNDGSIGGCYFRDTVSAETEVMMLAAALAGTAYYDVSVHGAGSDLERLAQLGAIRSAGLDTGDSFWQISEAPDLAALRRQAEAMLKPAWDFVLLLADHLYSRDSDVVTGDECRRAYSRFLQCPRGGQALFD